MICGLTHGSTIAILLCFINRTNAVDRVTLRVLRNQYGYDKYSLADLAKITLRLENANVYNDKNAGDSNKGLWCLIEVTLMLYVSTMNTNG